MTTSLSRRRALAAGIGALAGSAAWVAPSSSVASAVPAGRRVDVVEFGAAGDGSGDSTASIQQAVDSAAAAGGGVVGFAAGTYLISRPLRLPSRVHLVGEGSASTVLKAAPGSGTHLVETEGFARLYGTGRAEGPYGFSIRHLSLDGSIADNRSGDGLRLYGYGYALDDVIVRHCGGRGIVTGWHPWAEPDGTTLPGDTSEAFLSNFKVHDCGRGGLVWGGPHDSQLVNGVVARTHLFGAEPAYGIHVQRGGGPLVAFGVHVWGNSHTHAWVCDVPVHLHACQGEGARAAQVLLRSNDSQIHGGHFFGAGAEQSRGVVLGDSDHRGVTQSVVRTKVSRCGGGAVDLTYAGSCNVVDLSVYQTSGPAQVGTVSPTSRVSLAVNGVGLGGLPAENLVGPVRVAGHLHTATPTHGRRPSVKALRRAGAGAVAEVTGNDTAGVLTIRTGSDPQAGAAVELVFSSPYPSPARVLLTPTNNAAGGAPGGWSVESSGESFRIRFARRPRPYARHSFTYLVVV